MSLVNLLRKVNCRRRQVNVAGVLYNGKVKSADERGAASLRLIAALLLVNRNGVAGESSPCDWVSFNRCSATLTCDPVAINRCSAAFNRGKATLTSESSQLTCCSAAFNRGEATLTSDPVAINRCSAAFNLSSSSSFSFLSTPSPLRGTSPVSGGEFAGAVSG